METARKTECEATSPYQNEVDFELLAPPAAIPYHSSKCFTIWSRPVASCREKSRVQRKLNVALAPNKWLILAFHGVRENAQCWSFDFSMKFRDFSEIFDFAVSPVKTKGFSKENLCKIAKSLDWGSEIKKLRKITKFQRKIEGPTLSIFSYRMKSNNQPFIWCQCNF